MRIVSLDVHHVRLDRLLVRITPLFDPDQKLAGALCRWIGHRWGVTMGADEETPQETTIAKEIDAPSGALKLSDRETEVAEMRARGLPHGEIANHLMISRRTVDTHMSKVRDEIKRVFDLQNLTPTTVVRLLQDLGYGKRT